MLISLTVNVRLTVLVRARMRALLKRHLRKLTVGDAANNKSRSPARCVVLPVVIFNLPN